MNNFVLNSWIRSAIPGLCRLHKQWYESNKCTWAYPLQVLIHIMATTIPPRTHPHLPPLAHISSQFCQAPFILLEFSSVAKLKVHKNEKWINMLVKFPLFVSFQTCWKAAWEQNFESLVSQKACSLTLCIQACTRQSMQRPVKAFALLGNPSLLLRTKYQFSTQSAAHFFKFQLR